MNKEEKAYIAGFIDGEGCITFIKHMKRDDISWEPKLEITNTDKNVLEWIAEKIPESSLYYQEEDRNEIWKTRHYLRINKRKDLLSILKNVEPYLIVKSEQAKLMIEFLENRKPHKSYTEREIEIAENVRTLNRKGYNANN